jgi:hypothetical protein
VTRQRSLAHYRCALLLVAAAGLTTLLLSAAASAAPSLRGSGPAAPQGPVAPQGSIEVVVEGGGRVTSDPPGIDCSKTPASMCRAHFTQRNVRLTATPSRNLAGKLANSRRRGSRGGLPVCRSSDSSIEGPRSTPAARARRAGSVSRETRTRIDGREVAASAAATWRAFRV